MCLTVAHVRSNCYRSQTNSLKGQACFHYGFYFGRFTFPLFIRFRGFIQEFCTVNVQGKQLLKMSQLKKDVSELVFLECEF